MNGLNFYKEFVDKCVGLLGKDYGGCINARRMRNKERMGDGCPDSKYNVFLDVLNDEQLELLAQMLDDNRQEAIHDFLAMLEEDMCDDDGLRLVKNGVELPVDPFDSEIYYDFICRCEGDDWPKAD